MERNDLQSGLSANLTASTTEDDERLPSSCAFMGSYGVKRKYLRSTSTQQRCLKSEPEKLGCGNCAGAKTLCNQITPASDGATVAVRLVGDPRQ